MKFKRQEYHRYKRLGESWRKPRGKHNKVRRHFAGKMISPAIGYKTCWKNRGKHPSGYQEVLVSTVSELEDLDREIHAVRISGKVGGRKKETIQQKAEELGLKVLNPSVFEVEEAEEE
jgi:large subunit ribosomal protein L32e